MECSAIMCHNDAVLVIDEDTVFCTSCNSEFVKLLALQSENTMSLTKYNSALADLKAIQKELDKIAYAHGTLGDPDEGATFARMSADISVALDDIREFVSKSIAPQSKDCDINVIEQ